MKQPPASGTDRRYRAIISVGTNSTRLLVVQKQLHAWKPITHKSIGTRLGEGLRESGHLADLPIRRTLDAVARLNFEARHYVDAVAAIATSAMRRADNAAIFSEAVENLTGAHLHVLTGDEEARCSFVGALVAHPPPTRTTRVGVLDVGGGSTEYALGTEEGVERSVSCEIGAVRLTEKQPSLSGFSSAQTTPLSRICEDLRNVLSPLAEMRGAHTILAVGGSASAAAAIVRNGNSDAVDGTILDRRALAELIDRTAKLPLAKRKELPGLGPQRADIFPAGVLVINEALAMLKAESVMVSTGDLLLGYLSRN